MAHSKVPTKFPCWCRALYNWGGETHKDLAFVEGDVIECLNLGDGSWWVGRLQRDKRRLGLFPSNYVEILEDFPQLSSRSTDPLAKLNHLSEKEGARPSSFFQSNPKRKSLSARNLSPKGPNSSPETYEDVWDFLHFVGRSSSAKRPEGLGNDQVNSNSPDETPSLATPNGSALPPEDPPHGRDSSRLSSPQLHKHATGKSLSDKQPGFFFDPTSRGRNRGRKQTAMTNDKDYHSILSTTHERVVGTALTRDSFRGDVDRSNTPGPNERSQQAGRSHMAEYQVIRPIDEFHDLVEGSEGVDGAVISKNLYLYDGCPGLSFTLRNTLSNTTLSSDIPHFNASKLATEYLCQGQRTMVGKLSAIFVWCVQGLLWSHGSTSGHNDEQSPVDTTRILKQRQGTSREKAAVVFEMCCAIGVPTQMVKGSLRHSAEELLSSPEREHWWNAVIVDNEWRFLDVSLAGIILPYELTHVIARYFLIPPLEFCWTHIPVEPLRQHLVPPAPEGVLRSLPVPRPEFFEHGLSFHDFDTTIGRLVDLELCTISINVPNNTEILAEVSVAAKTPHMRFHTSDSNSFVKMRALSQASWYRTTGGLIQKRFVVKALLPDGWKAGVLRIHAGRTCLRSSITELVHPLVASLPISHVGSNPVYEFVKRHSTPYFICSDLYVITPQCFWLAAGDNCLFRVRQHSAAVVRRNFRKQREMRPAKLALQSPSGKIVYLVGKTSKQSDMPRQAQDQAGEVLGTVSEAYAHLTEVGVWRGVVLAEKPANWYVFAEWECVDEAYKRTWQTTSIEREIAKPEIFPEETISTFAFENSTDFLHLDQSGINIAATKLDEDFQETAARIHATEDGDLLEEHETATSSGPQVSDKSHVQKSEPEAYSETVVQNKPGLVPSQPPLGEVPSEESDIDVGLVKAAIKTLADVSDIASNSAFLSVSGVSPENSLENSSDPTTIAISVHDFNEHPTKGLPTIPENILDDNRNKAGGETIQRTSVDTSVDASGRATKYPSSLARHSAKITTDDGLGDFLGDSATDILDKAIVDATKEDSDSGIKETSHHAKSSMPKAHQLQSGSQDPLTRKNAAQIFRDISEDDVGGYSLPLVHEDLPQTPIFHTIFNIVTDSFSRICSMLKAHIKSGKRRKTIRITWQCACGSPMHAKITELKPGAAVRLQDFLRSSSVACSDRLRQTAGVPSTNGSPNNAATSSSSHAPAAAYTTSLPTPTAENTNPNLSVVNALNPSRATQPSAGMSPRERRFLLLCISSALKSHLAQIDVTSISNDEYMFDLIRSEIEAAQPSSKHLFLMSVTKPLKARVLFLIKWLSSLEMSTIAGLDFVRFRLVPIREATQPWNFTSPSLPPEHEVKHQNYLYVPCPQDDYEITSLDHVMLHSLLTPGPHLDRFWLDQFPKKLKIPLSYITSNPRANVAWGIRLRYGINWTAILWIIVLVVILSGMCAVTYSILLRDPSGAFQIAGYVVTAVTLNVAYLQLKAGSPG